MRLIVIDVKRGGYLRSWNRLFDGKKAVLSSPTISTNVLETGASGIGSLLSGNGQAYRDPSGETFNRFEHVYDANGRITDVTDPEGGSWHYGMTNSAYGTIRTELTTAEGQQTVYLDRVMPSGEFTSLITGPSGGTTEYSKSENGLTVNKSLSCGMDLLLTYAYDPGYRFKYVKSKTMTSPSGLAKTVTEGRVYVDVDNDRVLDKTTKTLTVNGNAFTYLIDKTQDQKTLTTPKGRITTSGFDPDTGLTTWTNVPGIPGTPYLINRHFSLFLIYFSWWARKVTKEPSPRCGKHPGHDGFRGVGKNSLYIMDCRDWFRRSCLSSATDLLTSIRSDSLPP
ncbi:MAG: hypothetical protein WA081_09145 [Desulfosalsimonadaceae bacterium]